VVNNLFLWEEGLREIEQIYRDFSGVAGTWEDVVYEKKKLIMTSLFGGEVRNLEEDLLVLAAKDRQALDASRQDLRQALLEVSACLPVYRTYIRNYQVSSRDREYLAEAFAQAQSRQPGLGALAFNFLRRVLFLEFSPGLPEEQKKEWLRFVCRWQQFTGPIMAKGLEDTAAYVYNPLLSLNEVGGCRVAVGLAEFHAFNAGRQHRWPGTLNTTSTHDTKRSEDVRARLNVLTEMPDLWRQRLAQWRELNAPLKKTFACEEIPDANEEIFLYQTLLGAWPLLPEEIPDFKVRLRAYLIKALREAKVHSRWIDPKPGYEQALLEFTEAILREAPDNTFLPDFLELQDRLAYYGALNSLSQVLLKVAAPGVPDIYQGQELWDFSLVDPDNRRPVDFKRHQRLLKDLKAREARGGTSLPARLLSSWRDGRLKLFLTYKALQTRRDYNELFIHGAYLPLAVAGPRREQVVAWARRLGRQWAIVLAGRFYARLGEPGRPPVGAKVWHDNPLPLPEDAPHKWQEKFTGITLICNGSGLPLAEIFSQLPVALLINDQSQPL
jgi:(1->4)-alpha-D-glucan 1-alpha-D-glucosylmutase